jgi:glycine cleavage system H protein
MESRRFSKEHEWADRTGDIVTIGITDYAQSQLGDVVYVELPKIGAVVTAGNSIAVVESVKAASEVYTPLSGSIVEINTTLTDDPAAVNGDPEGGAWFFKVRLTDETQWGSLLTRAQYEEYLGGITH